MTRKTENQLYYSVVDSNLLTFGKGILQFSQDVFLENIDKDCLLPQTYLTIVDWISKILKGLKLRIYCSFLYIENPRVSSGMEQITRTKTEWKLQQKCFVPVAKSSSALLRDLRFHFMQNIEILCNDCLIGVTRPC